MGGERGELQSELLETKPQINWIERDREIADTATVQHDFRHFLPLLSTAQFSTIEQTHVKGIKRKPMQSTFKLKEAHVPDIDEEFINLLQKHFLDIMKIGS